LTTVTEPEKATTTNKTEEVRLWFNATEKYLNRRRFDIQIRTETIQELIQGREIGRILDIGCGDGSISVPLLTSSRRLTLLDISSNMLALAHSKVPANLADRVELVNQSFTTAPLEPRSYDLILCIGVLAHVDSPAEVVAKIATLLKPGGTLILEFTDSRHFVGRVHLLYHAVWRYVRPVGYRLNVLSEKEIAQVYDNAGFRLSAVFRYSMPPPGSHRVLSQKAMYKMTRALFGALGRNRNRWLGNEFILRLENQ
jgi:2-polyprenyl-3-methyl-5-hydroxy-6-metoxy-1,4-benzoquinol methylase